MSNCIEQVLHLLTSSSPESVVKVSHFCSLVQMYGKSHCTTPGIVVGGCISKMLKFYNKGFFIWWARHCQASSHVCGQVLLSIVFHKKKKAKKEGLNIF